MCIGHVKAKHCLIVDFNKSQRASCDWACHTLLYAGIHWCECYHRELCCPTFSCSTTTPTWTCLSRLTWRTCPSWTRCCSRSTSKSSTTDSTCKCSRRQSPKCQFSAQTILIWLVWYSVFFLFQVSLFVCGEGGGNTYPKKGEVPRITKLPLPSQILIHKWGDRFLKRLEYFLVQQI